MGDFVVDTGSATKSNPSATDRRARISTLSTGFIHRFAVSGCNGLALCKNAHRMFDQGLWTVTEGLEVAVADGGSTSRGRRACCCGRRLHLPRDAEAWSDPAHLDWHRRNVFAAG